MKNIENLVKAKYWEDEEGSVRCTLCPHKCLIREGENGFCGVRKNIGGVLYSISSSVMSAMALDPIEKKPLFRFEAGSKILSIGSIGCNMDCPFCQNSDISRDFEETQTVPLDPESIISEALRLREIGNIGLAFTYNEPTVWYEAVLDLAVRAKKEGLKTALITNGYICEKPLKELLPYIDAMNIDLKAFNKEFYSRIVKGGFEDVKKTIQISVRSCHVELTTLIIPGLNDSEEEMRQEAQFIAGIDPGIPLHITRFFPRYKMTDKSPTPVKTLQALEKVAREYLKDVILGNV